MVSYVRILLIFIAASCLGLAFFSPIATYKALDAKAVESFIGGQQGLDSIAEGLTFQIDRYISQDPQAFAQTVTTAGGEDLCRFGICSWINRNPDRFAEMVSERVILPSSTGAREYIRDNYEQIVQGYSSYTADIPLMAEKRSNVFAVAKGLYDNQTWLLFGLVTLFAIITPVLKLAIALLGTVLAPKGLMGALWTLVGKLSMVEVFALASIVTAYSNLPLIQITPGWFAVAGYAGFTILILTLDLLPAAKPVSRATFEQAESLTQPARR